MPDEVTPTSPAPVPPAGSAPLAPEGGGSTEKGPIPYERFSQVNEQRKQAVEAAQAAQQQAQAQQQEILAWRQWAAQQQQAQAQQQAAQTAGGPPKENDPVLRALRADLGGDEAADKAIDVMEQYSDYAAQKRGYVRAEDVQAMIIQALSRSEGKTTSAFAVSNRFQSWVSKGMISAQDAQGLQMQLGQYLQQYPQVAEDPNALNHVVSHMAMTAIENDRIKPFQAPPRTQNPLGAVSPHGGPMLGAETPAFDAGASAFSRLKKLTPERIRQLTEHSQRNHQGAMS